MASQGYRVALLDLVADLRQRGGVTRRSQLGHSIKGLAQLLLHGGMLDLGQQARALGKLPLQPRGVVLDGTTGLLCRGGGLLVQGLELLQRTLHGHELAGESPCGLLVPFAAGRIAVRVGRIGEYDGLARGCGQAFRLVDLTCHPHLQLPLVTHHGGGLPDECLMLALGLSNRLVDLDPRIGPVVQLPVRRCRQVAVELADDVRHAPIVPRRRYAAKLSCALHHGGGCAAPACRHGRHTRHRAANPRRPTGGELGELQVVAHLTEQIGQPDTERRTDRGEQLRTRLLLPTFDLGEVSERYPRGGGHLTEGSMLILTAAAQCLAEHASEQDHRASSFVLGLGLTVYLPSTGMADR